jgi:hypothetical protein
MRYRLLDFLFLRRSDPMLTRVCYWDQGENGAVTGWSREMVLYCKTAGHVRSHAFDAFTYCTCSRLPCLLYALTTTSGKCRNIVRRVRTSCHAHAMPWAAMSSILALQTPASGLRCRQPSDDTWQAEMTAATHGDPPCRDTPGEGLPPLTSTVTLLPCTARSGAVLTSYIPLLPLCSCTQTLGSRALQSPCCLSMRAPTPYHPLRTSSSSIFAQ